MKSNIHLPVAINVMIALCLVKALVVLGGLTFPDSADELFISSGNNDAWKYVVKKYSTTGTSLTKEELRRMTKAMQKCGPETSILYIQQNEETSSNSKGSSLQLKGKDEVMTHAAPQKSSCKIKLDNILGEIGDHKQQKHDHPHFNQSRFEHICPTLLYYVVSPECCNSKEKKPQISAGKGNASFQTSPITTVIDSMYHYKKDKPTSGEIWGYGFVSVTIISCSSLVCLVLTPITDKPFYNYLLTGMIGVAVGSLTGSAFFHLVPQALRLADRDPKNEYLQISLVIVGGIWICSLIEIVFKSIAKFKNKDQKKRNKDKILGVIISSQDQSTVNTNNVTVNHVTFTEDEDKSVDERNAIIFSSTYKNISEFEQATLNEKPCLPPCHDHQVIFEQGDENTIATVAWMILFGDGLHNFIHGLSLGIAFNESTWTGVSISIAVLFEEVPHKIGNFAVLHNAGMSMRQAMVYNFLSACTCYSGMAAGILLGEVQASRYIFALSGGMFMYISLSDMVPEMSKITHESSKLSMKNGFLVLLLQNFGFFVGLISLYLLALYELGFQI